MEELIENLLMLEAGPIRAEQFMQLLKLKFINGASWTDLAKEFGYHPGDDTTNLSVLAKKLIAQKAVDRLQDPTSKRKKFIYFLPKNKSNVVKRLEKEVAEIKPKEKKQPVVGDKVVTKNIEKEIKRINIDLDSIKEPFYMAKIFPTHARDIKDKEINNAFNDYFYKDLAPTGKLGILLEKGIEASSGSKQDVVLYRGLRVDESFIKSLKDNINKKGYAIFKRNAPSSWAFNLFHARNFASKTGYRRHLTDLVSLIIEAVAPKGIKHVYINVGIPHELMISKKNNVKILKISEYRSGYRATGIFV